MACREYNCCEIEATSLVVHDGVLSALSGSLWSVVMKQLAVVLFILILMPGRALADSIFISSHPEYLNTWESGNRFEQDSWTILRNGEYKEADFGTFGTYGWLYAEIYCHKTGYVLFLDGDLSNIVFHPGRDVITASFSGWTWGSNSNMIWMNGFVTDHVNTGSIAVRTSVVPETGTLALLGMGLFGIAAALRRKKMAS